MVSRNAENWTECLKQQMSQSRHEAVPNPQGSRSIKNILNFNRLTNHVALSSQNSVVIL